MRLLNNLYTINGEFLTKKEIKITSGIVKRIRDMGKKRGQAHVSLKDTFIFRDFVKVFDEKKYANILKPSSVKTEIYGIAGNLRIENDIISELSAMKPDFAYTYYHVLFVAALAIKLSLSYKPDRYNRDAIAHCGFTHDIGKTRIPISILNKPGKLTEGERNIIETHPIIGYLLVNYYLKKDCAISALANLDHHERLDGSGYPKGIKKINEYAKLISIVDVLDALMARRPYRKKAYSLRVSLDYLLKESETNRFDKDIVLTLISLAREEKPDIHKMKISKKIREELPEELTHD